MMNAALRGKSDAGSSHVWFDKVLAACFAMAFGHVVMAAEPMKEPATATCCCCSKSGCAKTCATKASCADKCDLTARMKKTVLPEFSLKPGSTIFDAIGYFRKLSCKYSPAGSSEPCSAIPFILGKKDSEPDMKTAQANAKPLPRIRGKDLSFYDAFKLVCDTAGYDFAVKNGVVIVKPR